MPVYTVHTSELLLADSLVVHVQRRICAHVRNTACLARRPTLPGTECRKTASTPHFISLSNTILYRPSTSLFHPRFPLILSPLKPHG